MELFSYLTTKTSRGGRAAAFIEYDQHRLGWAAAEVFEGVATALEQGGGG